MDLFAHSGGIFGTIVVVLGLGSLGALAGVFILRLRRAGLALHRQLDLLRAELAAGQAEQARQAARFQEEISIVRERVESVGVQAAQIGSRAAHVHDGLGSVGAQVAQLQEALRDLALRMNALSDATEVLVRRPLHVLPIDSRLVESCSEESLIAFAESIAILRPLVPYPEWRTDADLNNPDLGYRLRRWFWQYFNDRKRDAPVVVPWHYGTRLRLFLGNDISGQIYIAGCMEPNEFAFLDRVLEPGMTFVDVGANDGIYTVFAGRRVGRSGSVWAFEPSAREVERLKYNLDLNDLRLPVFPIALADADGQAELKVGGFEHEAHNTLGAFAYQSVAIERKEVVEQRRLDALVDENPPARIDVIKIDVEGAEIRVLRGGLRTLRQYRPILLFEVSEASLKHQGGSREELLELVRSLRYRVYLFDRQTGLPVSAKAGLFADNMIGVPEEKPMPESALWPWPVRPQAH